MGASLQLPGGYLTLNPQPEISRYYNLAGTPYTDTTQVLNQVISPIRYIGQTFLVGTVEYWFSPTTADASLVLKIAGSAVSGTGIINYVAKWGTTSSLVNSLIYDNGTNVLINTITDNTVDKLQINGSLIATAIKKTGGLGTQYLMADGTTSTLPNPVTGLGAPNYISKWASGPSLSQSGIYEYTTGKVGIGTIATPKDLTFDGSADREISVYKTDFLPIVGSMSYSGQTATADYGNGTTFKPFDGITSAVTDKVLGCSATGDIYYRIGLVLMVQPYGVGPITSVPEFTFNPASMYTNKTTKDIFIGVSGGDLYKQTGGVGAFVAQGLGPFGWTGLCQAPNGDVYMCDSTDIYKQTGGVGSFVSLGVGAAQWLCITASLNGDIYVGRNVTGIYKQTGGVGSFVLFSNDTNTLRISGLATSVNGDIYASCNSGRRVSVLYKGTSVFVAIGNGAAWNSVVAHINGDMYITGAGLYIVKFNTNVPIVSGIVLTSTPYGLALAPNGDLYVLNNPGLNVIRAGSKALIFITTPLNPDFIAAAPNGDFYFAKINGDIYKALTGTTNFVATGNTSRGWNGITVASNGDLYAVTSEASATTGDIYRAPFGSNILVALGKTPTAWSAIAIHPLTGDIYTASNNVPYDLFKTVGAGQPVAQGIVGLTGRISRIIIDIYGDIYVGRFQDLTLNKIVGTAMVAVSGTSTYYQSLTTYDGTIVTTNYNTGIITVRPKKNAPGGIVKIKAGLGFGQGSSVIQMITGAKNTDGGPIQVEQIAAQFDENKTLKVFGSGIISGPVLINTTVDNTVDKLQVNGTSYFNGNLKIKQTAASGDIGLSMTNRDSSKTWNLGVDLNTIGDGRFYIQASPGGIRLGISETGNILIATTTDNGIDKLQVNGSASVNMFKYIRGIDISNADLNNCTDAGFYNGTNLTNAPTTDYYYLTVQRHNDTSWTHQQLTGYGGSFDSKIYTRTKSGGIWGSWIEILTTVSGFTGTGTLNSIPLFTDNKVIGDSVLKQVAPLAGNTNNNIFIGSIPETARDARFYVNSPSILTNAGGHSFGDYTPVSQTSGGSGISAYASYDSLAVMSGDEPFAHFFSFQGRNVYQGSGNLGIMGGNEITIIHNGTGVIHEAYAFRAEPKQGTGPIDYYYGLKLESSTLGITNNFGIYTGLGKNILGDDVAIGSGFMPQCSLHIQKSVPGDKGAVLFLNNSAPTTLNSSSDILFGVWSGDNDINANTSRISVLNSVPAQAATDMVFVIRDITGIASEGLRIKHDKTINIAGNVLINTTTDNGVDKLQVNGSVLATSFKKSGGLSTQYLMADGSVSTGGGSSTGSLEFNVVDLTVWNNGKANISSNTSFGDGALKSNTTGFNNTAYGFNALQLNTTANFQTAFGYGALSNHSGAAGTSTAIGYSALTASVNGSSNTAIGAFALSSNQNAGSFTAIGNGTLSNINGGSSSIGIGMNSGAQFTGGSALTSATNSIFIGNSILAAANNSTNEIIIGTGVTGLGNNSVIIGTSSTTKTALRGNVLINKTTDNAVDNLQVNGSILATSIKKSGGLVTEALIADGSSLTLTSGTYTPTFTALQNSLSADYSLNSYASYTKVGTVVTVSVGWSLAAITAVSVNTAFSITLPFPRLNSVSHNAGTGGANYLSGGSTVFLPATAQSNSATTINFQWTAAIQAVYQGNITFQYLSAT